MALDLKLGFGGLRIRSRLLLLIGIQLVVILALGVSAQVVLNYSQGVNLQLNDRVEQVTRLNALSSALRTDMIDTTHAVNAGSITWQEAQSRLALASSDFESGWSEFVDQLGQSDAELAAETLQPWLQGVRDALRELAPIVEAQDRQRLTLFVGNDLDSLTAPFLNALVATTELYQLEAEAMVSQATDTQAFYSYVALLIFLVGLALAVILGYLISQSIAVPVGRIAATVEDISSGNYDSRTGVTGRDELGSLGSAFDRMLDERVATLTRAQEENEALNDSVIDLLQAVSQLSQRDLRVRVPVTEGVTGPVADALNLLTAETARVLDGVRSMSHEVARSAQDVKRQSDRVLELAQEERLEVEQTSTRLTDAARRMAQIAKLARSSAEAADKAITTTQTAMQTVTDTVTGITRIRDTIREAEKRIKRLGDRSQEISGVVNLINSIAERTHILALNASMHAASAGEAGRGFAVVADEVQRLAENARDATGQISTLVSNIQIETADTVTTMNDVISQVVDGSKLAEAAGEQMRLTRSSTENLVDMVQKIAAGSTQQARTSVELSQRAELIRKSTEETSAELTAQADNTNNLVGLSGKLLSAVEVFKLPAPKSEATSVGETRAMPSVQAAG